MRARFLGGFVAMAATIAASVGSAWLTPAAAQTATKPAVRVSVSNVATRKGFILAALYDETTWGGTAVALTRVPADGDVVTLSLAAPSPGRYGIRLFHDVDADGVMDANLVGLPTEPFGFSNNAPIQFGPPSFSAAAFDVVEAGATQTIALR